VVRIGTLPRHTDIPATDRCKPVATTIFLRCVSCRIVTPPVAMPPLTGGIVLNIGQNPCQSLRRSGDGLGYCYYSARRPGHHR
jgi:hypothetical protein